MTCKYSQLSFEHSRLSSEHSQLTSEVSQTNCKNSRLTCEHTKQNCELSKVTCEISRLTCEYLQQTRGHSQINCGLEHGPRLLCGCTSVRGTTEKVMDLARNANADRRDEWIVIGISGVTCGGKTTLANRLRDALTPVYIFHQDKYFYPDDSPRHVKCEGLDHNNYDILSALDMQALHNDVLRTMQGENKAHHFSSEREGRFSVQGKKFLVVEGFTVLNYGPIQELCDLRYYLVLEYGECLSRRVLRLYDPPDIAGYFERCVWPHHLRYRAEMEKDKRVTILDGAQPGAFETVMADLKKFTT